MDDYLNKREIGAKAPSKYMKSFSRKNHNIDETMKSHLINDLSSFGIWDDNYENFLKQRAKAVSRELKKRVIEQEVDKIMSVEIQEDYMENNELEIL